MEAIDTEATAISIELLDMAKELVRLKTLTKEYRDKLNDARRRGVREGRSQLEWMARMTSNNEWAQTCKFKRACNFDQALQDQLMTGALLEGQQI